MCASHNQYKCIVVSDLKDQRWVQIHSYLKYRTTALQFALILNCWWIYISLNMYHNSKHVVLLKALISEVSHQLILVNEQQHITKTLYWSLLQCLTVY